MSIQALIASVLAAITGAVGGIAPTGSSLPLPHFVHEIADDIFDIDFDDDDDQDDDWDDDWDD